MSNFSWLEFCGRVQCSLWIWWLRIAVFFFRCVRSSSSDSIAFCFTVKRIEIRKKKWKQSPFCTGIKQKPNQTTASPAPIPLMLKMVLNSLSWIWRCYWTGICVYALCFPPFVSFRSCRSLPCARARTPPEYRSMHSKHSQVVPRCTLFFF